MKELLLAIHIGGAVVTGAVVAASFAALAGGGARFYRRLALFVGLGGGFQLVSGALLVSSDTVLSFCSRIGVYAFVVLATEAFLALAMRRSKERFPKKFALYPLGAGMAVSLMAVAVLAFR